MAEVLGVVASGIAVTQLAGQITSSIIKLKGYWGQIREAPAEINRLLQQIDSLNLMLQHMQDDRSQQSIPQLSAHNACVQRSLDLCKDCAKELSGLVNDLAVKIQGKNGWRKKVGSAKVVLSKEDIKNLKRRLKTSMGMLSLAYQFHTSAMIQLQPDIIMTRVVEHMTISQVSDASICAEHIQEETCHSHSSNQVTTQYDVWTSSPSWMRFLFGQYQYEHRRHWRRGRSEEAFLARYKLPEIVSCYQVACWAMKPRSGWWINLDFHRTISRDDPFVKAVDKGDVPAVRSLLSQRKAFVTDRIEDGDCPGYTGLHLAARHGNAEICRLLLEQGANPLAFDRDFKTPLHHATEWGGLSSFTDGRNLLDTCRVLVESGADDVLIDEKQILLSFNGSFSAFNYLKRQEYPLVNQMSPGSKLELVTLFASRRWGWHNRPFLLEEMLSQNGKIDLELLDLASQDGQDMLHNIVNGWIEAFHVQFDPDFHGSLGEEILDASLPPQVLQNLRESDRWTWQVFGCHRLIRAILSTGFPVQQRNSDGETLLSNIISHSCEHGYWWFCSAIAFFESLISMLTEWLKLLHACGINLQEYGAWEKEHFKSWDRHSFRCYYWREEIYFELRIISFDYGPRPEDWKFWFSEPSDPFAGDFWTMIEEERYLEVEVEGRDDDGLAMPGAWNEDL